MTLTNIAMMVILLGFIALIVVFSMEMPEADKEMPLSKIKRVHKKSKKPIVKMHSNGMHRRAA